MKTTPTQERRFGVFTKNGCVEAHCLTLAEALRIAMRLKRGPMRTSHVYVDSWNAANSKALKRELSL